MIISIIAESVLKISFSVANILQITVQPTSRPHADNEFVSFYVLLPPLILKTLTSISKDKNSPSYFRMPSTVFYIALLSHLVFQAC